jgi:hypothetical protein
MSFHPSPYSGANALQNPAPYSTYSPYSTPKPSFSSGQIVQMQESKAKAAKAGAWASGISAVGSLAAAGMQMGFQASAMKSQQRHQQKLAKQQEKLIALQTQQSLAQGEANRAAAAIAGFGTKKTFFVVGGVVMTIGVIVAAVVAVKRSGGSGDEYEYEDEGEYE